MARSPRLRSLWLPVPALLVLAGGAVALRVPRSRGAPREQANAAAIRDGDIAFFQRRVASDPGGAIDLARLAALYLDRFRQLGEESDLLRAEQAARRSFANRGIRNPAALQLLEAALLGQHRFPEAKQVAEQLVALDPEEPAGRAVLGEVLLELGDYRAADTIFGSLTPQRYRLALAPRYARWLEVHGRIGEARALLEWARDQLEQADPLPVEQLAWYELRLGELALRFGAYGEARRRLDAGLALTPESWRLLAARARLARATGDYPAAVRLGDASLALHLDPATLAEVGDAWLARGDSAQAEEYYRAMEAASQAPRGGFHRSWYLALLDHHRQVPEVLQAVRRDLAIRRDVYGWDLLAWALYQSGDLPAARVALENALAQSTNDPLLLAHAAAIEAAP